MDKLGWVSASYWPMEVQIQIQSLIKENQDLKNKIELLGEELRLLTAKRFGRSSEKIDDGQLELFDVAEEEQAPSPDELEEIEIPSHTRKKQGRKPIDPSIERRDVVIDIAEEEKQCACGCQMVKIEGEVAEKLQIIPDQVYVERTIRPKDACRNCEGSGDEDKPVFRQAPTPPFILQRSIVTPSVLSSILVGDYADNLPLYRMENLNSCQGDIWEGPFDKLKGPGNLTVTTFSTLKTPWRRFLEVPYEIQ